MRIEVSMSYSECRCVAGGVGGVGGPGGPGGGVSRVRVGTRRGGGGRAGGTRRRALSACGRAVLAARAHTRT